jgi:hypothetical protein
MSLSIKDVEDYIVARLAALQSGDDDLFGTVRTASEEENRITELSDYPAALVCYLSGKNTGVRSRLVIEETYEITIVQRKTGTSRTIHTLHDAVRDAIHGKDWNYDDIDPFQYAGADFITNEGQLMAYSLKFTTVHKYGIPTTT